MKFQRVVWVSLLTLALAACNFSLAEDIAPPPGAATSIPQVATPAAAASSDSTASASPAPAGTPDTTPASAGGVTPTASEGGATPTASEGGVTVSGKVNNGSGGSLPAGLTVTLHGILNQQETLNLDQPLNPDGSYSFENVALASGTQLIAVVPYGPVNFLSDGAVFDGTATSYDQPVTIYESSPEQSGITLDQVHIQAAFATPGQIQLSEIYVLTVPGNSAITVVTDGSSLPFVKLPEGALQAAIDLSQSSAPLAMADNGFAMLPGQQYAFVVSFSLPYAGNKATLSLPFILSPASVTVIVPAGVTVAGDGLTDQGANAFQGGNFQVYSSAAIKAGDSLALSFSGSPQATGAPAAPSGTPPVLLIGLGSLGLLLVTAGLFLFLRDRRKRLQAAPAETFAPVPLDDETARLADAILALDDRFAAGKIEPDEYNQQRADLKEKLKGRL